MNLTMVKKDWNMYIPIHDVKKVLKRTTTNMFLPILCHYGSKAFIRIITFKKKIIYIGTHRPCSGAGGPNRLFDWFSSVSPQKYLRKKIGIYHLMIGDCKPIPN